MVGVVLLLFTAPLLADYALSFGSFEFFWLAFFGVIISGRLTAMDDPLKGWIAGFLGLILATVGQEQLFAYARFSYDIPSLTGGISLIPAMVGAFGLVEILSSISNSKTPELSQNTGVCCPRPATSPRTRARSGAPGLPER